MCLAVPSKIVSINENGIASVDVMGVRRDCSVKLTPEAKPGDCVLVHAGFAIQIITEQDAEETLELLRQMPDLVEELTDPDMINISTANGQRTLVAPGVDLSPVAEPGSARVN